MLQVLQEKYKEDQMTENVSFKVFLKDLENGGEMEVRRFVVDREVSTSFAFLEQKLCSVFPQLKQKIFSIYWTDEDGDMVTIAKDEELIIALTEMPGPVYKMVASVKSQQKSENTKKKKENVDASGQSGAVNKKVSTTSSSWTKEVKKELVLIVTQTWNT